VADDLHIRVLGSNTNMTITDKARKLLWGRSGNRCAVCKQELIVSATDKDSEAVVGDECHIVSGELNGPRHDPSYPQEKLDSYENLILLCRVHHKMVDDQATTFTAGILRQLKNNHEIMISEKLSDPKKLKPVRLRRIKKNIPDYLVRVTTGKQLVDLIAGTYAFSMDHDELNSQEEVDLIGSFLQDLRDWMDIIDDAEPSDRVNSSYHLTQMIRDIEEKGFFVFGGREVQLLEGGIEDEPSNWPVAIVHVLRNDNRAIISQPC
jgi:hypothetical protein